MTRDAESLVLEADYARACLDELRELHDLIGTGSATLADALVSSVALAALCRDDVARASYEEVVTKLSATLDAFKGIQDRANAIGRLWDGRLVVLDRDAAELRGESA